MKYIRDFFGRGRGKGHYKVVGQWGQGRLPKACGLVFCGNGMAFEGWQGYQALTFGSSWAMINLLAGQQVTNI